MTQDWWVGDGTVTDPRALNIVPNPPVPVASDIPLRIEIGVNSRIRLVDEAFKPTVNYNQAFIYTTDLENYTTLLPAIAGGIWTYVASEKSQGAIVETHIAIWLDNVTHPWVADGVVRLPKGHRDTQLSNEEFTSAQVLLDHLTGNILDVRNTAKYN